MMSKIKLILDVAKDLRNLADSVQAVVDAMSENDTTATEPITSERTATFKIINKYDIIIATIALMIFVLSEY